MFPKYAQKSPTYTQKSPTYAQKSPKHTQKSLTYTQKSSTDTQKSSTDTQKSSTYTQKSPTYTQESPKYTNTLYDPQAHRRERTCMTFFRMCRTLRGWHTITITTRGTPPRAMARLSCLEERTTRHDTRNDDTTFERAYSLRAPHIHKPSPPLRTIAQGPTKRRILTAHFLHDALLITHPLVHRIALATYPPALIPKLIVRGLKKRDSSTHHFPGSIHSNMRTTSHMNFPAKILRLTTDWMIECGLLRRGVEMMC